MSKTNTFLYGRTQQQLLSLPNLIHWGDHFSVDHAGIDAQHKKIFNLGLTVYENWYEGGGIDKLHPLVDKLASLLEAHFLYEEGILGKINYEDLDEHVEEHQKMLNDMETLKNTTSERFLLLRSGQKSSGGSVLAPSWPLMQFFLGFTIGHVGTSDMRYYKALMVSQNPG